MATKSTIRPDPVAATSGVLERKEKNNMKKKTYLGATFLDMLHFFFHVGFIYG